tara:strand:- start:5895 stop:6650 length:756 start_codon:yes stop_codon:yes gene_type:complete
MKSAGQLDLLFDAYRVEERVSKRARCIRIEIHSPTEVRLTIPQRVPKREARAFLLSRESWVREKIAEMKLKLEEQPRRPSPQLRWDGSDTLLLRGQEHKLKLIVSKLRKPAIRYGEGVIEVFVSSAWLGQTVRLNKLLRDALKSEAHDDASQLLETEAARLGVEFSGPRIADQKTLWGSCTAEGRISLSWRLVMAPPEVLRYVVIHELCHIRHHDHSERFWKLVARQMPEFEQHRRWLGEHGPRLHWWLAT